MAELFYTTPVCRTLSWPVFSLTDCAVMELKAIMQLVHSDMQAVNRTIEQQLSSDIALINQLGLYIVQGGGKRLRPLLTVLAARALNYSGQQHIALAAVIEFVHTATLLHDDVVDESDLRRGRQTANAAFGNAASVLVGDFLHSRSFQMMVEMGSIPVLKIMSDATTTLAEGEVLQLMNCNDPETTEESYMTVIYRKTAKLFEAAGYAPAIMASASEAECEAMRLYGMYLGTAFQLIDDVLDYAADSSDTLGKSLGDDLAEGKPTLPLLHAMHHGNPEQHKMIRNAIEQGNGLDVLQPVLAAMAEHGSLDYARQRAEEEADKAIAALAPIAESDYKQALISLAHIAVNRAH